MKIKMNYKLLLFFMVFLPVSLLSSVPRNFSVQGVLTDSQGKVRPDGNYQLNFSLYSTESGGEQIWKSNLLPVSVQGGIFSIFLGDANQPELPDFDKQYWLGVTVYGESSELKPRLRLGSVPYSMYAQKADTAKHLLTNVIPVGTILSYAGILKNIPEDWMVCDGRGLSSANYPELFSALQSSWGNASGDDSSATDFNIPDLRGMFLRGVSMGSGNDPDAEYREAPVAGANSGDNIGTVQVDASGSSSDFSNTSSYVTESAVRIQGSVKTLTVKANNEVRPKNASVYYIIKIR